MRSKSTTIFFGLFVILPKIVSSSLCENVQSKDESSARSIRTTWMDFPPYVFRETDDFTHKSSSKHSQRNDDVTAASDVGGAIYELASNMIHHCCVGERRRDVTLTTEVKKSTEIEENLDQSQLAFPVTRHAPYSSLDDVITGWLFLPVIQLPGSYVLVDLDTLNNIVLDALFGSWPLAVLVLSASGISGFVVWFLDRSENQDHFPMSFVEGGWEGLWWAIVTATTVGYGDRAPRTILARVFGLAWMLLGIILMSIFTATLVSAIQAEDKVGRDIKGAKVAVVSGSQEERNAFAAGATPVAFATFEEVLDELERETGADFALVDPFFALYFSDALTARNIHPQNIVPHTGVHGILAINASSSEKECFARFVAVKHHEAFEFMFKRVGRLRSMHGRTAHHTSHKLLGSNMIVIYVCCTIFTLMFLTCCVWEFVCYKPKLRRLKMKARSRQLTNGGLTNDDYEPLNPKENIHTM